MTVCTPAGWREFRLPAVTAVAEARAERRGRGRRPERVRCCAGCVASIRPGEAVGLPSTRRVLFRACGRALVGAEVRP